MSENLGDFHSQLAAVMEVLVKSVVCETTKLFQSSVIQLRVEIVNLKKENEDLKSRLKSSGDAGGCLEPENVNAEKCEETCIQVPKNCLLGLYGDTTAQTGEQDTVSLKEDLPRIESVLIKQEEPDTEECMARFSVVSKELHKEPSINRNPATGTSVGKLLTDVCDDGGDILTTEGEAEAATESWGVWGIHKTESKNQQDLHAASQAEARNDAKDSNKESTGGCLELKSVTGEKRQETCIQVPKNCLLGLYGDTTAQTGEQDTVSLKEELPGIESVLIKQEEPDTEECMARFSVVSKELHKEPSITQDPAKRASVDEPLTDDCEDGGDTLTAEGEAEAATDRWGVWWIHKTKSKNQQDLHAASQAEAQNDAKDSSKERPCEFWPVRSEVDSHVAIDGHRLTWPSDSESQFSPYTEEGASCKALGSLSGAGEMFLDFIPAGGEAGLSAVGAVEAVSMECDVAQPRPQPDHFHDQQDVHEHLGLFPGHFDSREAFIREMYNRPSWDRQPVGPGGLSWQCHMCWRVFSSATALEAHQCIHTGEQLYSCNQCGKAFPSLRGLNRHSLVHLGKRQHQCSQCGKHFVYPLSLTKHQLVQSGERTHVCKNCDKTFTFNSDLAVYLSGPGGAFEKEGEREGEGVEDSSHGEIHQGKQSQRANLETWKWNIQKKRRMMGQSYLGRKNQEEVLKEEKKMGLPCQSTACRKSAKLHCQAVDESKREEIFKYFWGKLDWQNRKLFVKSLVEVSNVKRRRTESKESRRSASIVYYLVVDGNKMRVCQRMFLSTLGIKQWVFLKWVGRGRETAEKTLEGDCEDRRTGPPEIPPSWHCRSSMPLQ